MLEIKNLKVTVDDIEILQGIDLSVQPGSIHAIMGPNGSGKSTLAYTLMGHPAYTVTSGTVFLQDGERVLLQDQSQNQDQSQSIDQDQSQNQDQNQDQNHNIDVLSLSPDKRAKAGIFLSFQQPLVLAGVRADIFLLEAYRAVTGHMISVPDFTQLLEKLIERLGISHSFIVRNVNEGFSGGEKKKFELLQLALLKPKIAILDEIDSGLDIDALKSVADGLSYIRKENPAMSFIIITHYRRILDYIRPDQVHIIDKGVLVASGDYSLVDTLELHGYEAYCIDSSVKSRTENSFGDLLR